MSIIDDFGKAYTFKRYAKPTVVKGQLVQPVEVLNSGQPWSIVASIQPMGTFTAANLPEGLRNRDANYLYTETLMQVPDEKKGLLGDRILLKGLVYEVSQYVDQIETDLPHYKYIIALVPNA